MLCHFLWFLVAITIKAREIRARVSAADLISKISKRVIEELERIVIRAANEDFSHPSQ